MLNKYISNTKKLNTVFTKINFNNLNSLLSATESIQNIIDSGIAIPKKFEANTKEDISLNVYVEFNKNNAINLVSVTESIQTIINNGIAIPKRFEANTKESESPTKFVFNDNKINDFHKEILQYSARYIKVEVDVIEKTHYDRGESILKKLIINNRVLDYGTESIGPENFEVFIDGLHLPGIFTVNQVENNIEITITQNWIIDDRVLPNDIKVFGKIKP